MLEKSGGNGGKQVVESLEAGEQAAMGGKEWWQPAAAGGGRGEAGGLEAGGQRQRLETAR